MYAVTPRLIVVVCFSDYGLMEHAPATIMECSLWLEKVKPKETHTHRQTQTQDQDGFELDQRALLNCNWGTMFAPPLVPHNGT